MQKAKRFIFLPPALDTAASKVAFSYAVELESGERLSFQEKLTFPTTETHWRAVPPELHEKLLQSVSLALGVSYYKMHCAPEIATEEFLLTDEQANFWNTLYTKGLGEFFYRNNIDFRGLVRFPAGAREAPVPVDFLRRDRALVAFGGGKDSIVSAELLKKAGTDFELFSLRPSAVQKNAAALVGSPVVSVEREPDQEMVRLSKSGEVYNGHVPVSSIYMFAGLLAAALLDYRYLVFSNERSANYGNVEYLGEEINHQWSKSLEFEMLAHEYVQRFLTPSLHLFSLLRPLSEVEIIRRFAEYPQYFSSFSSCNRNFSLDAPLTARSGHAYWCGSCPKCAFVFAGLAAFVPKDTVVDIFSKDLFADEKLLPLYRELLGLEAFKPFECVGTPEETAVALERAAERGEYAGEPVMEMFERKKSRFGDLTALEKSVLTHADAAVVPESFRSML
ncbi:MAG: endonuclease domain-containing protein [Minisyncoccia bacterium]